MVKFITKLVDLVMFSYHIKIIHFFGYWMSNFVQTPCLVLVTKVSSFPEAFLLKRPASGSCAVMRCRSRQQLVGVWPYAST